MKSKDKTQFYYIIHLQYIKALEVLVIYLEDILWWYIKGLKPNELIGILIIMDIYEIHICLPEMEEL
jgi:hypothetical protein